MRSEETPGKLLYVIKRPKPPPFSKFVIVATIVFIIMFGIFGTLMIMSGDDIWSVLRLIFITYMTAIILLYVVHYFSTKIKKDYLRIYENGISISFRGQGRFVGPPKSLSFGIPNIDIWQFRGKYHYIATKDIENIYTIASRDQMKIWLVIVDSTGNWYTSPIFISDFFIKMNYNLNAVIEKLRSVVGAKWEEVYIGQFP